MEDMGKDFWISESRDKRVQYCSRGGCNIADTSRMFCFQTD